MVVLIPECYHHHGRHRRRAIADARRTNGSGEGDQVEVGALIVVLEAMKMEQPLTAHKAGTIAALTAEIGAVVTSGATICEIKD